MRELIRLLSAAFLIASLLMLALNLFLLLGQADNAPGMDAGLKAVSDNAALAMLCAIAWLLGEKPAPVAAVAPAAKPARDHTPTLPFGNEIAPKGLYRRPVDQRIVWHDGDRVPPSLHTDPTPPSKPPSNT